MGYSHERVKNNGKTFYRLNKGNAIVVSLIFTFLVGGSSVASYRFNNNSNGYSGYNNEISIAIVVIAIIVSLLAIAYGVFLGNIISMGCLSWFNKTITKQNTSVGEAFAGFKNYWSNVGTMFVKNLIIGLFTLLLVVPGIIKAYEYMMVEYIKMENPQLNSSEAMNLSSRITNGHKGDMFYLDLSFWGWFILGALTLGILNIVYVTPYYLACKAFAYQELKAEAISKGIARPDEFGDYMQNY